MWPDFLSGLLARHDAHMAMFVLDPRLRASSLLRAAKVFGRFAESTRQEVLVVANAWNVPDSELTRAAAAPLGIGPIDF